MEVVEAERSREEARSPRIPIFRNSLRLRVLPPCGIWALEKGFRGAKAVVVVGPLPVPVPGKGLTRLRPSSRDHEAARGLSHRGPVPPPRTSAITSPQRCRGSRPARQPGFSRPRGRNGGVPSRAPPRVAGPYKGKLACARASGRFGEPGSRFRLGCCTFLRTGWGGCVRCDTWGHAGRLGPGFEFRLRH